MLVTWAPTSTTASPPVFSSSHPRAGRADRPDQREGDKIQPHRLELRVRRGGDQRVHHRLLRGHQQQTDHLATVDLDLLDQVVVEDRLVDRHRDELLDLEPERLPKLLLGHGRQRDLPHHHALVPHAHPDLPRLEASSRPELTQGLRHGRHVPHLAVLDGTGGERHLRRTDHGRWRPFRQLGSPDRGRADVESDPRLRHYPPSTCTDRPSRKRSRSASKIR